MGASTLWRRRQEILPRMALAAAILATIAWAFVILGWSPTWYPALRWVILVVGVVAALGIALVPRARGVLAAGIAGFGIASIIAAPAAYSLNTAATPHSGAIPSAGPAIQGGAAGSAARVGSGPGDSAAVAGSAVGRGGIRPVPRRLRAAQWHSRIWPNGHHHPRGRIPAAAGPDWLRRRSSRAGGVRRRLRRPALRRPAPGGIRRFRWRGPAAGPVDRRCRRAAQRVDPGQDS